MWRIYRLSKEIKLTSHLFITHQIRQAQRGGTSKEISFYHKRTFIPSKMPSHIENILLNQFKVETLVFLCILPNNAMLRATAWWYPRGSRILTGVRSYAVFCINLVTYLQDTSRNKEETTSINKDVLVTKLQSSESKIEIRSTSQSFILTKCLFAKLSAL